MRSDRQGQINVSGFFWLSHIRAASSFWRLCLLVQQVTQRKQARRKPLVISHLYHSPCFNFHLKLTAADVWMRLNTLLLLAPPPASSALQLCFTQKQKTLISCTSYAAQLGFFCSSLPSATLLLHLTSPCLPHLPQHLPDWICWSSFSVYLIFPSADDYSNHWYLQSSGRYKQVSYILGDTVMVQTISDKAKVIKNEFCQCTVEKILLWMRLLVLPVDACWEIEEGKVSVFSLK